MGNARETIFYGGTERFADGLIERARDIIDGYGIVETDVFSEIDILDLVGGSLLLEPCGQIAIGVCVFDAPTVDEDDVHKKFWQSCAAGFVLARSFTVPGWIEIESPLQLRRNQAVEKPLI